MAASLLWGRFDDGDGVFKQKRNAPQLRLGNFALIRSVGLGRVINEHGRYWADRYGELGLQPLGKPYPCANAQAVLTFAEELCPNRKGKRARRRLGSARKPSRLPCGQMLVG